MTPQRPNPLTKEEEAWAREWMDKDTDEFWYRWERIWATLDAERAASEALRAEVQRLREPEYVIGDIDSQARAWIAVTRELRAIGLESFVGGDMSGRGRAVAFIQHIGKEAATLRESNKELAEAAWEVLRTFPPIAALERLMKAIEGRDGAATTPTKE